MIYVAALFVLQQAPLAPIKQPGTAPLFYEITETIERKLESGDFIGAAKLVKALPGSIVTIQWDDSKLSPAVRPDLAQMRDGIFKGFTQSFPGTKFVIGKTGQIKVSFTPSLPKNPESGLPLGAAILTSPNPAEPQVEVVIATKRGPLAEPASLEDLHNEFAHAFVTYFGVAAASVPGEYRYRTDQPTLRKAIFSREEQFIVSQNLRTAKSLRESIERKRRIRVGMPRLQADAKEIQVGEGVQGTDMPFSFQVTNLGNSPLLIRARPDCSCVHVDLLSTVDPGNTELIRGFIDTSEVAGQMNQRILVWTNDPVRPFYEVPISFRIRPLVRPIMVKGFTVYADTFGAQQKMALSIDPSVTLKPVKWQVSGLPADVSVEPFEAELPDPQIQDPARKRQGLMFTVQIKPGVPPGRHPVTVVVQTDHPKFKVVRGTFYVQTGIVVSPSEVYLGQISRAPKRGFFILSQPDRPFKIKGISTNQAEAKASIIKSVKDEEYHIAIDLNGKQLSGRFDCMVTIQTTSEDQPTIKVPVWAIVR